MALTEQEILSRIRAIPDYPSPGIVFRDITPLLADGEAFADVIASIADPVRGRVDLVAGIEARGFILAAPVAVALGVGFVPVRKSGKLPHETIGASYALEYGTAEIEIHADAVRPGQRVLLVDDVLATGGTARAACDLLTNLGGSVVEIVVLMELPALAGRERLPGRAVRALVST